MPYMFDTNICIYLLKRHPPEPLERLKKLRKGEALMSVVTHAELRAGLERQTLQRAHDEQILQLLIQRVPVLPFDLQPSIAYGRLRAAVPDRRRNALDSLIAAHAVSVNATLVTNNQADFKDYPGLNVENWVA
ncbi:MAG TPA: type II toxin-antitoxin system VapC family toxin [Thiobacillaceae bacterium]|nr:type II toxin-antitoxin system VapC family toxin [Thiobacillaceae bacterium]